MAPANTTSSPSPSASAKPFSDWTDFFNTVGTSIGPIITLFGEQATKQFLSMSMGWADNILLATGPIGIITIVVSAIRIGGYRWSQAILGRGREIVRLSGKPDDHGLKDLVITQSSVGDAGTQNRETVYTGMLGLSQACKDKILSLEAPPVKRKPDDETPLNEEDSRRVQIDELASEAPNLALSVPATILGPKELWFWAIIGILLQSFALLFPALATYYQPWKWPRKDVLVPGYAYPCFAAGTVAVIVGLLGCSHVVEGSTTEYTFKPMVETGEEIQQIVRLQMPCTVGSQQFKSFAILNYPNDMFVRRSHLSDNERYK
ncbi:MAG: hypothetical protein Q9195_001650 [Heterodermia aff. obscurata]